MFLIYKINEIYRDSSIVPEQPADAIYDVFYRFDPEEISFLYQVDDISHYHLGEAYMDCGDWCKGYTTYYNTELKEKHLVIKIDFLHKNPTIKKMIRDYKLDDLDLRDE